MKNLFYHRSKLISIAVSLCLTAGIFTSYAPKSAAAEETKSDAASQIRMAKIDGDVTVEDSVGKELVATENMRLFTGNRIKTQEKSYAFFNLDDEKAVKLDSISDAEIRESGKKMEVLLKKGGLLLDVNAPVENNARVNVRTSSMVMGIRGTHIYAQEVVEGSCTFGCLEGTGNLRFWSRKAKKFFDLTIKSGEKVVAGDDLTNVKSETLTLEEVPGFILMVAAENHQYAENLFNQGGMDLRGVTKEQAQKKIDEEREALSKKLSTFKQLKDAQTQSEQKNIVWAGNNNQARKQTNPTRRTTTPPPTPPAPDNKEENQNPTVNPTNDTGGDTNNNENTDNNNNGGPTKYKVIINSGDDGTIKASPAEAEQGQKVTLTVSPKSGFELKSISAKDGNEDSVKLTEETENEEYSFTMGTSNVTVTASFTEVEYNVKINSGDGGSVTAKPTKAVKGKKITLTVNPSENYELDSISATKANDKNVDLDKDGDNKYTFEMPASDVTVTASFKAIEKTKYTVTVNAGEGGTVSADNSSATEGTKVTLNVTPNQYYELDSISAAKSDNSAISLTTETEKSVYSFTMPADNVTVTASFKKIVKNITWTVNGEGGEFTCDKPTTAEAGSTVAVEYQVSRGYSATVTVNGTALGETEKSFVMPEQDTEVVLTITALTAYHITIGEPYAAQEGGFGRLSLIETASPLSFTYNGTAGDSTTDLYEGDAIVISTQGCEEVDEVGAEGEFVSDYVLSRLVQDTTSMDSSFAMPANDVVISAEYVREFKVEIMNDEVLYAEVRQAKAGTTVTITVDTDVANPTGVRIMYYTEGDMANSGQNNSVPDSMSGVIDATKVSDNTYTFEMPTSSVMVEPSGY